MYFGDIPYLVHIEYSILPANCALGLLLVPCYIVPGIWGNFVCSIRTTLRHAKLQCSSNYTLQTESLNLQSMWCHDVIYGLYCRSSRKSWCTTHSQKLTSQRKTNHLKMHFLLKLRISHCYVSLPNSTASRKATQSSNSARKSTRNPLLPSKHLFCSILKRRPQQNAI